MATQTQTPEKKKRIVNNYLNLSRSEALNHIRTENTKEPVIKAGFKLSDLFSKRIILWFKYYVQSRFGKVHPYLSYDATGENGIYTLKKGEMSANDYTSIAITADWATDTVESDTIAKRMHRHNPDYTIHLGDTYFVGEPKEIKSNFINTDSSWVRGNVGSFALLGNHEMYAKGDSFFRDLLPTLGIKNSSGKYNGQKAGFFCLENNHWRILGLDTGYHSIGKIPIIEMLPWFAPDCHFNDILMKWLRDVVKLGDANDKRGLLVLTHHQYISAFNKESEYQKPADQLASLIGKNKNILWLWGHEHKFSLYEKAQIKNGVTAYGRCIGHGGMPIELDSKEFKKSDKKNGCEKLVMVDKRYRADVDDSKLGYNGYAVVKIKDAELSIEYCDIDKKLLTEKWNINSDGSISGSISPEPNCRLTPEPGKDWNHAIK